MNILKVSDRGFELGQDKKFKLYLFYNDYETGYTTYILIMLVGTDVCVRWSSCGRKPEYSEETHLSDLVTTWPSHMPVKITFKRYSSINYMDQCITKHVYTVGTCSVLSCNTMTVSSTYFHIINSINVVSNIVFESWYRQYWGNTLICMFSLSISDLNKCTRLATNERFCQLCCALLLRQYQNILRQREWHVGNKNVVTRGMTYDSTTRDNIKVWIVCIVVLTRGWPKYTWYC